MMEKFACLIISIMTPCFPGGDLEDVNTMSGVAADINMWSFAMSDDEIESLYSFFPRGDVMNEDTIRIAGTLTQTQISTPKSILPGRVSILTAS